VNQPQRNRSSQRRRAPARRPAVNDVWREPAELPEVEPIAIPTEVGAVLRSLGDAPMHRAAAGHYFTAVVERAAAVGVALAHSADLIARDRG
jgi:hypothetical protein